MPLQAVLRISTHNSTRLTYYAANEYYNKIAHVRIVKLRFIYVATLRTGDISNWAHSRSSILCLGIREITEIKLVFSASQSANFRKGLHSTRNKKTYYVVVDRISDSTEWLLRTRRYGSHMNLFSMTHQSRIHSWACTSCISSMLRRFL